MTKLWFSAKRYGYGWYPSSREGWIVMALYLALLLLPFRVLPPSDRQPAPLFVFLFVLYEILLTIVLIWICFKKGEKLGWRWGSR